MKHISGRGATNQTEKRKERRKMEKLENKYEGKYYIVRGDRSGVFAGEIVSRNGQEIEMKNVRRLWYWDGACSISELAEKGTQRPYNCKFTVTVCNLEILDAIEVTECTAKAKESIKGVKEWKY